MQYIYDERGILTPAIFPETAGIGVQVPSNGIILEQELKNKKGYVWVLENDVPKQAKDNRGTYYSKETRGQVEFDELGAIPDSLTSLAPSSEFDEWDGKKWVKNESLELSALKTKSITQKDSYLALANEKIKPLQDAVDLDIALNEEVDHLKEWKRYRVLLNRIEQQENFPMKVDWPEQPFQ